MKRVLPELSSKRPSSRRAWLLLPLFGVTSLAACKMDLGYLSEGDAGGSGGSAVTNGLGGSESSGDAGDGVSTAGGAFSSGGQVTGGGGTEAAGGAGRPTEEGGGAGDAGAPSATPKYDIVATDGRILAGSNSFGIDGEWRKFGSDVSAIETRFVGAQVCIQGKIVGGGWGGGLQLVLHAPATEGGLGRPYDAVASGLAGIRFVIEGATVPVRARVKFKQIGTNDDYCRELSLKSGDLVTLRIADALRSCPTPGGGAVNPTQLENFEIHLYPEAAADLPIDFCVKQVTAMPAAD